jgi:hypothetical protein
MKKQMIGTHIFPHIIELVSKDLAPKITGMIIDLPVADLNQSIISLAQLQQKVRAAVNLLIETGNISKERAEELPINNL